MCGLQVELISWKSTKDISGDGGVIKTVKQAGEEWEKPSLRDEVMGEPSHSVLRCKQCSWVPDVQAVRLAEAAVWQLLGRPLCSEGL